LAKSVRPAERFKAPGSSGIEWIHNAAIHDSGGLLVFKALDLGYIDCRDLGSKAIRTWHTMPSSYSAAVLINQPARC
jgi:hypothetical protein